MIDKIISIIKSCKTSEQLIASKRFMFLYLNTIKSVRERFNIYDDLIIHYNQQRNLINND